jgi:hypothetical protein
MSKPRVLIPISLQFSIRYLLRSGLLSQLSVSLHPVILLGWKDKLLEQELEQAGCEVHPLQRANWGTQYERVRSTMNQWHEKVRNSPSTVIREYRQNLDRPWRSRIKKKLRSRARTVLLAIPGGLNRAQTHEQELFWSDTNAKLVDQQLKQLRVDALFCLTPFLTDEEMTVRVAALSGVRCAVAILSFDNLTTRPWIPINFDLYLLWNQYNVDQLRRGYPHSNDKEVEIVGSPQFDFYWKRDPLWSEEEWRRRLALPPHRPVLLFAGGYFTCAPHEPQFLGQLDDAIETKQIPGNPMILFRRHPVDPIERWQAVLRVAKNVVLDNPWELGAKILGHTNVTMNDISKLASTLCYSNVHVNVASTMTVDGAIFDKPQVGPAYDDSPSLKYHRSALECYHQEHFLPITSSGGIAMPRSKEELISAVRAGFVNPAERRGGRRTLVKEICTFTDGECTQRVASAIRKFVGQPVPPLAFSMSNAGH